MAMIGSNAHSAAERHNINRREGILMWTRYRQRKQTLLKIASSQQLSMQKILASRVNNAKPL